MVTPCQWFRQLYQPCRANGNLGQLTNKLNCNLVLSRRLVENSIVTGEVTASFAAVLDIDHANDNVTGRNPRSSEILRVPLSGPKAAFWIASASCLDQLKITAGQPKQSATSATPVAEFWRSSWSRKVQKAPGPARGNGRISPADASKVTLLLDHFPNLGPAWSR